MSTPTPTITVPVDVTNPGQFFACCGLLELADRLWPGAEGWFADSLEEFHISGSGDFHSFLGRLRESEVRSSLGEEGLRRLGTLLSAKKSSLTATEQAEKVRLRDAWQAERLILTPPIGLMMDWWWNATDDTSVLKTWAAKQLIINIVQPMLDAVKSSDYESDRDIWVSTAPSAGLPLNYDSDGCSQNTALDRGFSAYDLNMHQVESFDAFTEFLSFVAYQRFRPERVPRSKRIAFAAWHDPLPPIIASAAITGAISSISHTCFQFEILYRTKYMKSFLPATPIGDSQ